MDLRVGSNGTIVGIGKWHTIYRNGGCMQSMSITGPVLWWTFRFSTIDAPGMLSYALCPKETLIMGDLATLVLKFGSRAHCSDNFQRRRYKASKWLCQDIIAQRWPPWSGSKPIWRFARMWWNAHTNDPCRMDAGAGTGPGNQLTD